MSNLHPICLSHGTAVPDAGTGCQHRTHSPGHRHPRHPSAHGRDHSVAKAHHKKHVGTKRHSDHLLTLAEIRNIGPTDAGQRSNFTAAFKRIAADAALTAAIAAEAAASTHPEVTASVLTKFIAIDSSGNKAAHCGSFYGLMQLGPAACKDVGADYATVKLPEQWKANLTAGRKYADLNADALDDRSLPITAMHLYMCHNQGAHGGSAIIRAGTSVPGAKPVAHRLLANNVTKDVLELIEFDEHKITSVEFYAYWQGVFSLLDELAAAPVTAAPSAAPSPAAGR